MVVFMKWIYTLLMVLCEAIALRKPVTAGHSEQEFPWCYTETVMGSARMVLNLCKGEENTMNGENNVFFFYLLQLPPLFFQIRKRLILSDKGQLDWKKMYFKLIRCYPRKEQYGDTLQLCRHCHILSWKVWSVGGTALVGTGATGQSDCSSLKESQFLCLHKLVCRHRKYLGSPSAIKTLLLCFRLSHFLYIEQIVAIEAQREEDGCSVGLPAVNHAGTAHNSCHSFHGGEGLGRGIS